MADVARANILALESEATDTFVNIGAGVKTTIAELVDRILAITGSALRPEVRADEHTLRHASLRQYPVKLTQSTRCTSRKPLRLDSAHQ